MEQLEEIVNSSRLSDYSDELKDQTISVIFSEISKRGNHAYSHLFSDRNPYLEENRRVIAQSQRMKDYMSINGITNLDNVTSRHATRGLGGIIGFKKNYPKNGIVINSAETP